MAKLQKSIDKRAALLKATLYLVNSGGIQEACMAKVAKMADVSPATIYLYFENKQDMINQLYLAVKEDFTQSAFDNFDLNQPVKLSFEQIWFNMFVYKQTNVEEASFLSQCDNTPMIDDATRQAGLKYLQPLFDLWTKGQREGIIKDFSPFLLYAFTVYPIAFFINMQKSELCEVTDQTLKDAFRAAWDSIKV